MKARIFEAIDNLKTQLVDNLAAIEGEFLRKGKFNMSVKLVISNKPFAKFTIANACSGPFVRLTAKPAKPLFEIDTADGQKKLPGM